MSVERSCRRRQRRRSSSWLGSSERFSLFKPTIIGRSFQLFEAEPVPKKDKLTKLKVEVGEGKEVTIVTNAKHCDPEKVQNRIKD